MHRNHRRPLALGAAGVLALGVALGWPQAGTAGVGAATRQRTTAGLADSIFVPEAAPRLGEQDAINLAAAPPDADPVAFDQVALRQAQSAPRSGRRAWTQVGPTGAIINSLNYAIDEGRKPTTGIGLSLAADPSDKTGDTVYAGTGGGLWKTSDSGKHWRFMAIPAMPVAAVGVDPTNHRDVYAATGQGFQGGGEYGGLGLYYSHDAGASWHVSKSSVHGAGQQVSVSPKDGTVFVGTTGGLFRSTNHGVTFTNVKLPTNAAGTAPATGTPVGSWTSDVQIRPGRPSEVFAAVGYVAGNVLRADGTHAAPGNGLYKSTQFGKPGTFQRIDIHSTVSGWEQEPAKSADPIGRTRLVFTPDGKYLFSLVADAGHRSGGAAGPVDPALVLGIPHPTSLNGVYRSGDDGKSWNLVADSETLATAAGSVQLALSAASLAGYNPGIQAWYNGWIGFDDNTKRLLVGEEEVYQSAANVIPTVNTPGGPDLTTWQSIDAYVSACGVATNGSCPSGTPFIGGQVTHPDQHGDAVVLLGGGKSRLWIGNDGGVFHQNHASGAAFTNGAWTSGAHFNELLPYRAVEGANGEVIAGLQDNGSVLYPPHSSNSYEICGGDGTWVGVDPNNPNIFYCNANGSTDVTTDGGKTTTDISPSQLPTFEPAASAMDPTDPNHLVEAAGDVVETTKGPNTAGDQTGEGVGTDWVDVYSNGSTSGGTSRTAKAVAVHGANVYVSSCGLCQSSVIAKLSQTDRALATNTGKAGCTPQMASKACWHQAKLEGMPARQILALAIDPNAPKTVYLATAVPSAIRVAFGGKSAPRVLVSHDAGGHVTDISGNLPRGNIYDIKVIRKHIYAATDYGVFVAKQGSRHWSRLGHGMPVVRVFGINLSADGHDLVAATYGLGVWLYPLKPGQVTHVTGGTGTGSGSGSTSGSGSGSTGASGTTASTGMRSGVAVTGLLLLVLAALTWRRRTLLG